MELVACMEEADLRVELEWTPREANQEADALSNHDSIYFAEEMRIPLAFGNENCTVLQEMLAHGETFEAERKEVRERARTSGQTWPHASNKKTQRNDANKRSRAMVISS